MSSILLARDFSISVLLTIAICLLSPCSSYAPIMRKSQCSTIKLRMTKLTYNGKMVDFPPGSPLSSACTKMGIKPKYSCKKGECASCTISVGGIQMRPCVAKVPPEPKLKSLQEKGLIVKA